MQLACKQGAPVACKQQCLQMRVLKNHCPKVVRHRGAADAAVAEAQCPQRCVAAQRRQQVGSASISDLRAVKMELLQLAHPWTSKDVRRLAARNGPAVQHLAQRSRSAPCECSVARQVELAQARQRAHTLAQQCDVCIAEIAAREAEFLHDVRVDTLAVPRWQRMQRP